MSSDSSKEYTVKAKYEEAAKSEKDAAGESSERNGNVIVDIKTKHIRIRIYTAGSKEVRRGGIIHVFQRPDRILSDNQANH